MAHCITSVYRCDSAADAEDCKGLSKNALFCEFTFNERSSSYDLWLFCNSLKPLFSFVSFLGACVFVKCKPISVSMPLTRFKKLGRQQNETVK